MAEPIPQQPGLPFDAGQKRAELAYQERHDADIPTDDSCATPCKTSSVDKADPEKADYTRDEVSENCSSEERGIENSGKRYLEEGIADPEKGELKYFTGDETAQSEEPTPSDPNIVDWDGDNDPAKAVNWSEHIKSINIAVLSAITFIT